MYAAAQCTAAHTHIYILTFYFNLVNIKYAEVCTLCRKDNDGFEQLIQFCTAFLLLL